MFGLTPLERAEVVSYDTTSAQVSRLIALEGETVDAGEHGLMLIAAPVAARDAI